MNTYMYTWLEIVTLLHLTHWGRVTHTCIGKLTIIGSDNGLSPDRRQAIIWTNAGTLLIGPWATDFNGIFIKMKQFSFKKMRLKMSSGKRRPFCFSLNVLTDNPKPKFPDVIPSFHAKTAARLGHNLVYGIFGCWLIILRRGEYRKVSNIRRTKCQNLNDSRLVLQLSVPNPLKPSVKSIMKM